MEVKDVVMDYKECQKAKDPIYPPSTEDERIAKVQVRRVIMWGDERCPHPSTFDGQRLTRKKNCPECWQALLDEVKS